MFALCFMQEANPPYGLEYCLCQIQYFFFSATTKYKKTYIVFWIFNFDTSRKFIYSKRGGLFENSLYI